MQKPNASEIFVPLRGWILVLSALRQIGVNCKREPPFVAVVRVEKPQAIDTRFCGGHLSRTTDTNQENRRTSKYSSSTLVDHLQPRQ